MRRVLLLSLGFLLLFVPAVFAALNFPALSGRVVDEAGILSPPAQSELSQLLENYQRQSGNQLVVVTLRSLQGTSIEDFGYQLGRAWGIGQKGTNNGVLLIVAPNERKVRIEVGYGLEATLTDALSSAIIQNVILPDFHNGQIEKGVTDGTKAIIEALDGHVPDSLRTPSFPDRASRADTQDSWATGGMLLTLIIFVIFFRLITMIAPIGYPSRHGVWLGGSGFGGSSFGGGGFGGGFSGGGSSFGGGGASGSW